MTLHEFIDLPPDEQRHCWMLQSRYLMSRYQDAFTVSLYAVDCFFVEAWYDAKYNRMDRLVAFQSVWLLDDYLPAIQMAW